MMLRNPEKRARIGLYTIGLKAYWEQFPSLKDRLRYYGDYIKEKLSAVCEVYYYGIVDDEISGADAGEWFCSKNVDFIFIHSATYCTSASVVQVHQACNAPSAVLNLQPTAMMNYEKTGTGEWLANCGACPVPEIVNALERCGSKTRTISGLLGMDTTYPGSLADENTAMREEAITAWKEIYEYVQAAGVKRSLIGARFGFLGGYYSGMLDLYSNFTLLQSGFRIHIESIEMCDLAACLSKVSDQEIYDKLREIREFFKIADADSADPIVGAANQDELEWTAKVACAEERLTKDYRLDALAYYYHGSDGNEYEKIVGGMIVGNSLLTANSIPLAGEGDIKTVIAMKICDLLNRGGSFTEIVAADYTSGTIILGHDGPFHAGISNEKPILRGMRLYHGKKGSGISVEAKVRPGPVTLLGITENSDGKLKFIISEGEAENRQTLMIGNTQTHVRFPLPIDRYYGRWFSESPTHHCAMSIGHNTGLLKKTAEILNIDWVTV